MQLFSFGKIGITELMPEKKYIDVKRIMEAVPHEGFSDLMNNIDGKFSYNDLRMVRNGMEFEKRGSPAYHDICGWTGSP